MSKYVLVAHARWQPAVANAHQRSLDVDTGERVPRIVVLDMILDVEHEAFDDGAAAVERARVLNEAEPVSPYAFVKDIPTNTILRPWGAHAGKCPSYNPANMREVELLVETLNLVGGAR